MPPTSSTNRRRSSTTRQSSAQDHERQESAAGDDPVEPTGGSGGEKESASKQVRRRPDEVRALLLTAATRVFKAKGFTQATVEDIVTEAGVSPSVFYRNFRTKGALYRASMLGPFRAFLADFREVWQATFTRPWSDDTLLDLVKHLVRELLKHLTNHSDVLVGLVSADGSLERRDRVELEMLFDEVFAEMRSWGEVAGGPWPTPPNLELSDRLIMSMVSGLVLFRSWYLPHERRIRNEDLVDQMARLILYGISLEPPAEAGRG